MGRTDRWGQMRASVTRFTAAALVAGAGLFASTASAATLVDFSGDKKADPYVQDDFAFGPARIVNGNNGNCVDKGCLALNAEESADMTYLGTSGLFTLSGLSFNLVGNSKKNALTINGSNGTSLTFTVDDFAKNTFHTLLFGDAFADVSSVTFATGTHANVRIDDVVTNAAPAPIPLPAAAWLLLGGIGTLAAVRRRRSAVA